MGNKDFKPEHEWRALVKGAIEAAKAFFPPSAFYIGFEESLHNSWEKETAENRRKVAQCLRNARIEDIKTELKIAGIEREEIKQNLASLILAFALVWEEVIKLKEKVRLHDEILKRLTDFSRFPQVARILTLPLMNNLPHNRNIYFTGREDLIQNLRTSLCGAGSPAVLTQVIAGLGGVGKTQTAIEYCYRFGREYNAILWVVGERLIQNFANLATVLQLKEKDDRDIMEKVFPAIHRWLIENAGWLLIFDNAEKPDALREFLPKGGTGQILITSRNTHWGSLAKPIDVPVMKSEEAIAFLMERSGYKEFSETQKGAVETLSEELGYLPLALEQAAAYIAHSGCGFQRYLEYFRKQMPEMLKRAKPEEYPNTVATTWKISFDAAEKENPESIDLLKLCSFFSPDNIPIEMIRTGREFLDGRLKTGLALDDAILSLRHFSLVSREDDFLSFHRLVQAVTRNDMKKDEGEKWCASSLLIVNNAFPQESQDYRTWGECKILLPHGETILSHSGESGLFKNKDCGWEAGWLLNQVGLYYKNRGLFPTAEPLFRRALEIGEETLGKDHRDVAACLNNLANLLCDTGRFEEAEPLFRRALEIGEKTLGKEHPNVATSLNNLALLLYQTGRFGEAEPLFLRSLEITEKTLGKEHPDVAIRLNNLAGLLSDTGRFEDAEPLFRRALEITEKTLGKEHPSFANRLHNLGVLLCEKGRREEGISYVKKAYQIFKKSLGKDHPNTKNVKDCLQYWGVDPGE